MIANLTGLLLASSSACAPIAGADAVLTDSNTRWVILGEQHGTAETPQIFTDFVCLAAKTRRPVIVALEYPEVDQGKIDTFLASDGGEAARAALLTMTNWGPKFHDGRSSVAMFAMFDRLRQMKQGGQISGVVAFVPPFYGGAGAYNAGMADRLRRIDGAKSVLVLTLVGNVHAMKTSVTFRNTSFLPAAALLPKTRTVSLNIVGNGGMAWNCQEACTPHVNGDTRSAMRGIAPISPDSRDAGKFDATLELGVSTTASPPALP